MRTTSVPTSPAQNVFSNPRDARLDTAEYMGAEQIGYFRERLLEMKREIEARVSRSLVPDPVDASPADEGDRATQEEDHAMESVVRNRDAALLTRVEASLAAIENGTYGYCGETGEEIGLGRMLANPTARLTVEAQERLERATRFQR